jgi:hypothetical protein
MRLGGWGRLWIVFSGIWLVTIATIAWFDRPIPRNTPHSDHFYGTLSAELRDQVIDVPAVPSAEQREAEAELLRRRAIEHATMSNGHRVAFRTTLSREQRDTVLCEYDSAVLRALGARRRGHFATAFLAWLIPVSGSLALGAAVGWIYRGFRQRRDSV